MTSFPARLRLGSTELPTVTGSRPTTGFTLVELLVVMAIIGLLAAVATPRYFKSVDRARELALRTNLAVMRDSLDKHFADHGRYPAKLQDLVDKRYLRAIPLDPLTNSDRTWVEVASKNVELPGMADVRSGAEGKSQDGSDYATW